MQKVSFVVLFLLISFVASAQLSIGYRYGIGSFGVNFEPDTYEKFQTGYFRSSHGFIFTLVNENNAGMQVEVNYAQKGWHELIDTIPGTYYNRNLDYIEIPFLAHFEIGHKMLRPTILFGPFVAWQINDSWEQNGFDDQLANPVYDHYHQDTRIFNAGIKVGAGLRLNINKRFALFGELHYDLEMVGSRDIFFDRPEDISVSRIKETSGVFGVLWHIVPQKIKQANKGYTPKEDIYLNDY